MCDLSKWIYNSKNDRAISQSFSGDLFNWLSVFCHLLRSNCFIKAWSTWWTLSVEAAQQVPWGPLTSVYHLSKCVCVRVWPKWYYSCSLWHYRYSKSITSKHRRTSSRQHYFDWSLAIEFLFGCHLSHTTPVSYPPLISFRIEACRHFTFPYNVICSRPA